MIYLYVGQVRDGSDCRESFRLSRNSSSLDCANVRSFQLEFCKAAPHYQPKFRVSIVIYQYISYINQVNLPKSYTLQLVIPYLNTFDPSAGSQPLQGLLVDAEKA